MFATDSRVAHSTNFTLANAGRTIHVGSELDILSRTPAAPPPPGGDLRGAELIGASGLFFAGFQPIICEREYHNRY